MRGNDLKTHALLWLSNHVEFGHSKSNGVSITSGSQKNLGNAEDLPPWYGAVALETRPYPTHYHAKFGHSRSNGTRVCTEIHWKMGSSCPDLQVIQGHRKWYRRLTTYDFLLVVQGNYGPIAYRFWDKRRLLVKITFFSKPCVFITPTDWIPLEFCNGSRGQKARMMPLSDGPKFYQYVHSFKHNTIKWRADEQI